MSLGGMMASGFWTVAHSRAFLRSQVYHLGTEARRWSRRALSDGCSRLDVGGRRTRGAAQIFAPEPAD